MEDPTPNAPTPPKPVAPDAVDERTGAETPSPSEPQPAPHCSPAVPESETVQSASGVAWATGHTLRFPESARLFPGDRVVLAGRKYEIKLANPSVTVLWLKRCGLGALAILALIGIVDLFSGPPDGTITGVVVDRNSGHIITGAAITMPNGEIFRSNAAGLYAVDGLPEGSYVISASALGYEPQTGSITRTGDKPVQLAFALMPLVVDSSQLATNGGGGGGVSDAEVADAQRPKIAYGHIELKVDFEGYLVFVDNVLYGKNTDKVKRLTAGAHTITVQVEGYEDYASTIEVKARTTESLKIAKADLTPKIDPLRRSRRHFAEAKEHLDGGRWAAAIEAYDRGLEFDPENATALQYRGWAHLKMNDVAQAREDILRASTLHSDGNRHLDAVACEGYLIEIDPGAPDAYRRRAEYYTALREYEKAINDYKAAIKNDRNSLKLHLGLAETYFVAGDYKESAKEFDRARKLVDDPTDIYVRMLIALTRDGDDGKVRKKYKEFTEFADPNRLEQLRQNPEWLRVLQIVDPLERSAGQG